MNDTIMPPRPEPFGRVHNMEISEERPQQAVIIPMEASSVQRIVAGQAITDLASAVKELIDNALDAGSKSINIRLFNQGLDIVEVSDDGTGVPVESRPYMAMKHATSKIRSFDDIYETDSLGFRGEALFCLANISAKMVVATRTANQPLGQKLEFTREGYLQHDTVVPVPRKVGTTVAVVKLFDALPVRRADLVKRIQAQRREVFLMVQGYAIHCLGIKFNLFDMSDTGREDRLLSTMQGTIRLEQTISSVLGSLFLSGMSRISIDLPVDETAMWRVEGFVAKAPNVIGRDGSVARNAQFFSINGRPVDLPRISKTLSEAWRTFEGATKKKPACILQFSLPKNSFDINLAPNKRQVLLAEEKHICQMVREGVLSFWSSQRDGKFFQNELDSCQDDVEAATFDTERATSKGRRVKRRLAFVNDFRTVKLQHDTESNQLQGTSNEDYTLRLTPPLPTPSRQREYRAAQVSSDTNSTDANSTDGTEMASPPPEEELEGTVPPTLDLDKTSDADKLRYAKVQESFRRQYQQDDARMLAGFSPQDDDEICESPSQKKGLDLLDTPTGKGISVQNVDFQLKGNVKGNNEDEPRIKITSRQREDTFDRVEPPKKKSINLQDFGFTPMENKKTSGEKRSRIRSSTRTPLNQVRVSSTSATTRVARKVSSEDKRQSRKRQTFDDCDADEEPEPEEEETAESVEWEAFQGTASVVQASLKARLALHDRRKRLKLLRAERSEITQNSQKNDEEMVEEAGEDENSDNIVSLVKKDFEGMEVIGQFNLGFILAKCRKGNLWVLDQHACDEKYNFERLCATTVIHEQKLIAPMPLELSPSEESCVLENMEIFEQNGFRFEYKPDDPPRHRLALTALPHSGALDGRKGVQFGKDDVSALCAVLGSDGVSEYAQDGGTGVDGSGMYGNNAVRRYAGLSQSGEKVMTRLPKAVAMFANRACRGSIMIGTALSKKEMETIVQRLANVQHPWNCPHGRPTLKHVKDMLPIETKDERRTLELTAGPTVVANTDLTQPEE